MLQPRHLAIGQAGLRWLKMAQKRPVHLPRANQARGPRPAMQTTLPAIALQEVPQLKLRLPPEPHFLVTYPRQPKTGLKPCFRAAINRPSSRRLPTVFRYQIELLRLFHSFLQRHHLADQSRIRSMSTVQRARQAIRSRQVVNQERVMHLVFPPVRGRFHRERRH